MELSFKIPDIRTSIYQTLIGIADSVFAALVLYFAMRSFIDIPFTIFIGIFVIAQVAGVFSQVPGGLGVFESVFMFAMPPDANHAALFGALLAYRIIYYVLPLIGMGGMFFLYENILRVRMRRWLAEAAAKLPHIPLPKIRKK